MVGIFHGGGVVWRYGGKAGSLEGEGNVMEECLWRDVEGTCRGGGVVVVEEGT